MGGIKEIIGVDDDGKLIRIVPFVKVYIALENRDRLVRVEGYEDWFGVPDPEKNGVWYDPASTHEEYDYVIYKEDEK